MRVAAGALARSALARQAPASKSSPAGWDRAADRRQSKAAQRASYHSAPPEDGRRARQPPLRLRRCTKRLRRSACVRVRAPDPPQRGRLPPPHSMRAAAARMAALVRRLRRRVRGCKLARVVRARVQLVPHIAQWRDRSRRYQRPSSQAHQPRPSCRALRSVCVQLHQHRRAVHRRLRAARAAPAPKPPVNHTRPASDQTPARETQDRSDSKYRPATHRSNATERLPSKR